jgi:hypothetical protein
MLDLNILAGLVGLAVGVYLVGTAGNTKGSLALTLFGALFGQMLRLGLMPGWDTSSPADQLQPGGEADLGGLNMLCAMLLFYHSSRYDPALLFGLDARPRKGTSGRLLWVFGLAAAFWVSAGMGAYEHGSITINDQETGRPTTVRIKGEPKVACQCRLQRHWPQRGGGTMCVFRAEMVHNILASPAVQQFYAAAGHLYYHALEHGFEDAFKLLKEKLDFEGETSAHNVLGLEPVQSTCGYLLFVLLYVFALTWCPNLQLVLA